MRSRAFLLALCTAVVGCGDDGTSTSTGPVRLGFIGAPTTMRVGQVVELQVRAFNQRDEPVPVGQVAYSSSSPGVLSVSAEGVLRAIVEGGPVRITATAGTIGASIDVGVVLPAALGALPSAMAFFPVAGAFDEAGLSAGISLASGGGEATSLTVGAPLYEQGTGWILSTSLTTTTTPSILTVLVNPATLAAGTYRASIPVSGRSPTGEQLTLLVPVIVSASPPPRAEFDPDSITVATLVNRPVTSDQARITNAGQGSLPVLLAGTPSYVGTAGWITSAAVSGATLSISVNSTGLAAGTYRATVPITAPGAPFPVGLDTLPVTLVVQEPVSALVELTAGDAFTCGRGANGVVMCWGAMAFFANGNAPPVFGWGSEPRPVPTAQRFTRLMSGQSHACGVQLNDRLACWGDNLVGQLGLGFSGEGSRSALSLPATLVAQQGDGSDHACVVESGGAVWCWGDNSAGQLALLAGTARLAPGLVSTGEAAVMAPAAEVAAGLRHTCARAVSGDVYCWGAAAQLGRDDVSTPRVPKPVSGGLKAVAIAAGNEHSCAIGVDGDTRCWGRSNGGRLGGGGPDEIVVQPIVVPGGHRFVELGLGRSHSCGRTAEGEVWCWGSIFDMTGFPVILSLGPVPTRVDNGLAFTSITSGRSHLCCVVANGDTYCWGANNIGQLGDGTTINRAIPVKVVLP